MGNIRKFKRQQGSKNLTTKFYEVEEEIVGYVALSPTQNKTYSKNGYVLVAASEELLKKYLVKQEANLDSSYEIIEEQFATTVHGMIMDREKHCFDEKAYGKFKNLVERMGWGINLNNFKDSCKPGEEFVNLDLGKELKKKHTCYECEQEK